MALVDLTGFHNYEEHNFRVMAHSRGGVSELSGRSLFSVAHGAHWVAQFTLRAMCKENARKFKALVNCADGRAGVVLIQPDIRISDNRKTRYTDGTQFSDVTTFTDTLASFAGAVTVGATASRDSQVDQITITIPTDIEASELPGMIIGIGNPFGAPGSYQALECVSVAAINGQDVTIRIRPRLHRSIGAGDAVYIGSPPLRMKFTSDDPLADAVQNGHGVLQPLTLDLEEAD